VEIKIARLAIDTSDFTEYCELRRKLWPMSDDVNRSEARAIVADANRWAVFVARSDDRVAGFVEVHLRDHAEGASTSPVGFVEGWFVEQELRRQSIGGALISAAEQWARERGCAEMGSDTEIDNLVSIEAHQRLGYTIAERLVSFLKRL
jgi:aminoglycoside 6'-N-acetyltransferase I